MSVAPCPVCGGPYRPGHVLGPATWSHTIGAWCQDEEERTAVGDLDRIRWAPTRPTPGRDTGPDADAVVRVDSIRVTRPATRTERALLAHLGHVVPDDLRTLVTLVTRGLTRRTWPDLTPQDGTVDVTS